MVLGIDPSTSSLGYAVYQRPLVPVADGFIAFEYTSPLDYLLQLVRFLDVMHSEYGITEVACEAMFSKKNQHGSLLDVSCDQVQAWSEAAHLPFAKYEPSKVKLQVTGSGKSEKREVFLFMKKYLSREALELPRPKGKTGHLWDVSDAHAIAQTHIARTKAPTPDAS